MKKVYIRWFSAVCAAAALLIGATPCQTQECENNDDCPTNYACQVTGETVCVSTCAESGECTQPQDCESQNIMGCVALPCSNDDQCADGMVCYESSWEECQGGSVPDCSPEEKCEEPELEPVRCVTHRQSECIPVYTLPCKQDADCGEGFTCEEQVRCFCDGGSAGAGGSMGTATIEIDGGVVLPLDSGGAEAIQEDAAGAEAIQEGDTVLVRPPVADAEIPLQDEEPSCGCEPSGEFRCGIIETECSSESNCPKDWTCEPDPTQTVSCTGIGDEPSDEIYCLLDPAWINWICLPPYYHIRGISEIHSEPLSSDQGPVDGNPSKSPEREDAGVGGASGSTPSTVEKPSGKDNDKEHGGGCRVANIGRASDGILPFFTCILGFLFLWRGRRYG